MTAKPALPTTPALPRQRLDTIATAPQPDRPARVLFNTLRCFPQTWHCFSRQIYDSVIQQPHYGPDAAHFPSLLPPPAACSRLSSGSRAVSAAGPSCSSISGYSTGTVSKASPANTHLPRNSRDSAALGPAPATIPRLTGPGVVPPRSRRCRLGPARAARPTYGASYGRGERGFTQERRAAALAP